MMCSNAGAFFSYVPQRESPCGQTFQLAATKPVRLAVARRAVKEDSRFLLVALDGPAAGGDLFEADSLLKDDALEAGRRLRDGTPASGEDEVPAL